MTSASANPAINAWAAPSVVEQARSQLSTAERNAHDPESARALRTAQNALTKICALPAEILARILWWCTSLYAGDVDIVQLTHVCRRWREVVLAAPKLWTYHSVGAHSDADMLRTTLGRARGALLDLEVVLDEPEGWDSEAAGILRRLLGGEKGMGRVRSLVLVVAREEDVRMLRRPAPVLESFELHYTKANTRDEDEDDEDDEDDEEEFGVHIDADLFGGLTPALRELSLHSVTLPWTSTIFHNLTLLKLEDIPTDLMPSLDQLLSVLRAAPNLEYLELASCFPPASGHDILSPSWTISPEAVDLPQLQYLLLAGPSFFEYAQVLNHLSFPPSTSVRLAWVDIGPSTSEYLADMPLMPSRLLETQHDTSTAAGAGTKSESDSSLSVCLSLDRTEEDYVIQLHEYSDDSTTSSTADPDNQDNSEPRYPWWHPDAESITPPRLDAAFRFPLAPSRPHPPGPKHLGEMNLPAVRTLKLAGHWPPAEDFWRGVLNKATGMRRLSVGLEKPQALVGLLRALTPSSASSEGVLAPRLTELHLTGAAIKSVDPGIVMRVLDARARANVRLGKVTVDAARAAQGFAEALGAELVGEAEVDDDESVVNELSTDEDDSDDGSDGDNGGEGSESGESGEEGSEDE